MSSDPIEVLRENVKRWRKEESRHEEGMNSVDPAVSNYHEGMSQAFGECADELESALAPLSAPKPPPMNDNAVAVNESAPVNDKPESAEASAPVGVEGVVKAMRMLAGVGIPVKPECVGRWADQLEAMAQKPAAHPAITHCDNCGCDWLDNGLNPAACPYCKQPAAVDEARRVMHELCDCPNALAEHASWCAALTVRQEGAE